MPGVSELLDRPTTLASLPAIYVRVKTLVEDPRASMDQIAQVIGTDPALSARLLRIANSAFFGLPGRIETISAAVRILGTQQIHDFALATTVARAFPRAIEGPETLDAFWRHSVHAGVLARLLARRCNVLDSERLFVEGLLHGLGHLILYRQVPGPAAAARALAETAGTPLHLAERELIGCHYAEVGCELLRRWQLPASIRESVGAHPEPGRARDFPLESAIVHLAALRARGAALRAGAPVPPFDPEAWRITGLTPEVFGDLDVEADRFLDATLSLVCGGGARAVA